MKPVVGDEMDLYQLASSANEAASALTARPYPPPRVTETEYGTKSAMPACRERKRECPERMHRASSPTLVIGRVISRSYYGGSRKGQRRNIMFHKGKHSWAPDPLLLHLTHVTEEARIGFQIPISIFERCSV